ncbi:Transcriptional antiterminator, BglG [uncultured Pleomorphomonas sp.]|uniref:PRD domain-containing protein n=2 Tax=Pleomorphomonas TaxID=261933 RepID=A0A2G9X139_9HYPH|nr:PRD domain-containing protein [Pleomorphomonas carboxyditropha]PIP00081.1 hypothetical protein CJ014_04875 [Pleomorphomonas carboxyditropha]SCM76349.1 Transcriptional antiterminator, BglG [uncultured Pleomorphomonas sp.]
MKVVKVFNNNVALVLDEKGREVVVQGRGIAFNANATGRIDAALVDRRFIPQPSDTPEEFAEMVASIPQDHIAVAEEILSLGSGFGLDLDKRVLVALADHISIAIKRHALGQTFDNPLEWEVRLLYVREVNLGSQGLDLIEKRTGVRLPAAEIVPLALHFVNAQIGADQMAEAMRTVQLIREILAIIKAEYGLADDAMTSLGCARFATHLRYLFLSHLSGGRHAPLIAELAKSIREQEPHAYACAERVTRHLTQKMGWSINDDEIVYIALHIQRMTYQPEDPRPQTA